MRFLWFKRSCLNNNSFSEKNIHMQKEKKKKKE